MNLLPKEKQDFVFIGHNGGLGHTLTIPEISLYNMYDTYRMTGLPIELEFYLIGLVVAVCRFFSKYYKVSRYLVNGEYIGRIICIMRSPIDYVSESRFQAINEEIVSLIKDQYKTNHTRYFGLGNLNKMKQLNDGGLGVLKMLESDEYLKDKSIRLWTGDTMTSASVYYQLLDLPDLSEVFYIGANGKIGNAVCLLLAKKNIKIRIFSSFVGLVHENISYTQDMNDMLGYKFVVIGKFLNRKTYNKVLQVEKFRQSSAKEILLLDYTVPFMPIPVPAGARVRHIQIGVLNVKNNQFLRGYFDICMGIDQNQIYPCHAGCILNTVSRKETNEVGEINVDEIAPLWASALKYGLDNKPIEL